METQKLLNKKLDELTVGDALRLNVLVFTVVVGAGAVLIGVGVVAEKYTARKNNRKTKAIKAK